jgi:hypothetical protein
MATLFLQFLRLCVILLCISSQTLRADPVSERDAYLSGYLSSILEQQFQWPVGRTEIPASVQQP